MGIASERVTRGPVASLWVLDGLPIHPLIVHAPVVLIPLVAAGWALFVLWPASRRVLGLVLVAVALGGALAAIVAVESGEHLVEALGRGDTADDHAGMGRNVRTLAAVLAMASALVVGLDRSANETFRKAAAPAGVVTMAIAVLGVVTVALAGHSGAQLAWDGRLPDADAQVSDQADSDGQESPTDESTPGEESTDVAVAVPRTPDGIVDVVLGEWAIITSTAEAPPGEVRFRIRNAGTHTHALRIRTPGSGGDRLEWRSPEIPPGGEIIWTVDLPAGAYEVTCPVEDEAGDHDDLGMEGPFTVREGAPIPDSRPAEPDVASSGPPVADSAAVDAGAGTTRLDIAAFTYSTPELVISTGSTVVWTNQDPAPHTATGDTFDTGVLQQGQSGEITFDQPGTYSYFCSLHPSMTATVVVE